MEIKLKEVSGPGQKSVQEVEEQLLEQQEQQDIEKTAANAEEQVVEQEAPNFGEQDVLSFIKDRYNKEINSVDELFEAREKSEALPEDVSAFLKYKKETGRGIDDFMKLQVDYDKANPDQLLRDYYSAVENDLDSEDINYLMSEKFSYDEELDEESEIKEKKIAKKRELAKAKKYFNELKETYKVPVESASAPVNQDELETYNAYKEYISQSKSIEEENIKRSNYFKEKTDSVFNNEFKGFGFNIGEQEMLFSPGETSEIKALQSDINNFISKFLDEKGLIKDAVGYHKSLAAAMNPDKMAAYFYEKGKSDAVGDISKKSKNINMGVRSTPQQPANSSGVKIRAVDSDGGRGLKIKKR